jgi:chromosome segregation ATPase
MSGFTGVSHQFNHYMKERGHTGKVKVDHKLGKLEMEVIMSGGTKNERVSNTKTLSGGERSYSTLAFSLALGSEVLKNSEP